MLFILVSIASGLSVDLAKKAKPLNDVGGHEETVLWPELGSDAGQYWMDLANLCGTENGKAKNAGAKEFYLKKMACESLAWARSDPAADFTRESGMHGIGWDIRRMLPDLSAQIDTDVGKGITHVQTSYGYTVVEAFTKAVQDTAQVLKRFETELKVPRVKLTNYVDQWAKDKQKLEQHAQNEVERVKILDDQVMTIEEQDKKRFEFEISKMTKSLRARMKESIRVLDDFYKMSTEFRDDFWDNFDGKGGSTIDRLDDAFDDMITARDRSFTKAFEMEENNVGRLLEGIGGLLEKADKSLTYADATSRKTFDELELKLEQAADAKEKRMEGIAESYEKIDDEMASILDDLDHDAESEEKANRLMWRKTYENKINPVAEEYANSAYKQMDEFDSNLVNSDDKVAAVAGMAVSDLDAINATATKMASQVDDITDTLDRGKQQFKSEENATAALMNNIEQAQQDTFKAKAGQEGLLNTVATKTAIAELESNNYADLSELMNKYVKVGTDGRDRAAALKTQTELFFRNAQTKEHAIQKDLTADRVKLGYEQDDLDTIPKRIEEFEKQQLDTLDETKAKEYAKIEGLEKQKTSFHEQLVTWLNNITAATESDIQNLKTRGANHSAALVPVYQDFDDTISELVDDVQKHKEDVGGKAVQLLQDVEYLYQMVGEQSNEMLPQLFKYIQAVATKSYNDVKTTEGVILKNLADPVALAYDTEHHLHGQMDKDAQESIDYWLNILAQQHDAISGDNKALQHDVQSVKARTTQEFAVSKDAVDAVDEQAATLGAKVATDEEQITKAQTILKEAMKDLGGSELGADAKKKSKSWAAFVAALDAETQRVTTSVFGHGNASLSTIENQATEAQTSVEGVEQTTLSGIKQRTDGLVKLASDEKYDLVAKARDLKRSMTSLVAHMKGMAANTTEWTNRLKDEIAGEAGQLHTQAMLAQESKIGLQAAIDKRFRKLKDMVSHDVEGLEQRQQDMMHKLIERAEQEAQKVSFHAQLSDEDKAKRLHKINAWLVGNLESVSQDVGNAGTEYQTTIDGIRQFETESEARINSLDAVIAQDNSRLGLEEDQRSVATTKMGLEEMIEEGKHEVKELRKNHLRRMDEMHKDHATELEELKKEVTGSEDVYKSELDATLDKVDPMENRLKETAAEHKTEATELDREFQTFNGEADQLLDQLNKQMADQASGRLDRFEALKHWASGLGLDGATMEEKIVQATVDLMKAHDEHFKQHKQSFEAAEKRVKSALEGGNAQLLKKIAVADKKADAIMKKDDATWDWIHKYEEGTAMFRKSLAGRLDKLAGGLDNELGELAASSEEFKFSMDQFANATMEDIMAKVAETKKADAAAIAKVGAELGTEETGVAGEIETHLESDDMETKQASSDVTGEFDEVEQEESQVQKALTKLTDAIGSERPKAEQAVGHVARALETKQAEVDAAQEQVKGQLDNVDAILNPEEQASPESMLQENLELNAEHRLLGQELKHLESKYRSLTM